jgi:hypothetical protein
MSALWTRGWVLVSDIFPQRINKPFEVNDTDFFRALKSQNEPWKIPDLLM